MALVINDRVKETSSTTGTGALTFAGAVSGFETFSAGIGNSNTTYYAVVNTDTPTEWEVGLGTLAGDSSTITRTTVISSSNSDSAVNFGSGTKEIFCTLPASKAVIEDASSNVTLPNDLILGSDSSILKFGADSDTTFTHTDGTGLTLNSTNKICFNDASQFVQGSSATVLSLGATDEIDLTATAIDINGTCDISGTFSLAGTDITTTAAEINLIDGGTSRGTTAVASGDGLLVNDGGTMAMTNVDTVSTYFSSHSVGGGNIVTTGALDSGSITSGFGAIDNGTSNIRTATFTAETAFVPDASGGADLGTTSLEFNDAFFNDSAVINFGDDQDTTLTHTDGTGLTLNSTNKICFNDASQFIQGSSATVLSLGATDEIDLTATAIDINGTCDISGTFSLAGTNMTSTATELNKLDALDRGSIIYGNASSVTSILGQGSADQVLTSDGTDISWEDAGGTTINNNTDNFIITGTGTSGTLNGETSCRFDGNKFSINTTGNFGGSSPRFVSQSNSGQSNLIVAAATNTGSSQQGVQFRRGNGGDCGEITIGVDNLNCSYNSNSDYRMKENIVDLSDGTSRLRQLKPIRYNMIDSVSKATVDGFLAHEVSELVPEAVNGVKDETEVRTNVVVNSSGNVDADGVTEAQWIQGKADGIYASDTTWFASKTFDKFQSMDAAKLVPLLTAALKELETRVTTLEG